MNIGSMGWAGSGVDRKPESLAHMAGSILAYRVSIKPARPTHYGAKE